ncbi:hypothetical protein FJT64_006455 [Amphibalanus amphitrite]|uniref:Apple domain-containing protein n=1 Tax=Amphibalanus amphitrite TaxID=1232801 RepID=A0A6A4VSZ0_AMPAM|nr:hypothetical protein FJT64_006455 [Amphibalanus amphitrite]
MIKDTDMGGRSVRRRGPLPPQLPRLLLLMSLVLASASVEAGWSRIPASFLERIKSRELTLPPEVYKFDMISAEGSLYPDEIRNVSLKGVSLCACRHRCLTDLSCMGFEHQKEGGGQPDDAGYGEDCGGFFAGGWKLNDLPCSSMSVKQLCEYIGPTIQPSDISRTVNETVEGKTITWLTYDLREQQTVSRILYIASGRATTPTEVVQIRVGELPDDVSDLHSSRCVHQTSREVAAGFGRRFACAAPLVGRYLHVAQSPAISAPLAPTVAVFGMLQGSMTGV